jgi:hypothetical protein
VDEDMRGTQRCNHCGGTNKAWASFCIHCGQPLKRSNKLATFLLIAMAGGLLLIAIAAIIGIGAWNSAKNDKPILPQIVVIEKDSNLVPPTSNVSALLTSAPTSLPTPTYSPISTPISQPTRIPTPKDTSTPVSFASDRLRSPTPTPSPVPTATPQPISCSNRPQGEFFNLWQSRKDWFGCPVETSPLYGKFAEMPFQKGHLFWLGNIDIYGELRMVIATFGGQEEGDIGTWSLHQENWNGESICSVPAPPEGLYLPDRGLAQVWCEIGGINRLGYATAPQEFVSNRGIATIQNFDRAIILRDSDGYSKRLVYVLFRDDSSYIRVTY